MACAEVGCVMRGVADYIVGTRSTARLSMTARSRIHPCCAWGGTSRTPATWPPFSWTPPKSSSLTSGDAALWCFSGVGRTFFMLEKAIVRIGRAHHAMQLICSNAEMLICWPCLCRIPWGRASQLHAWMTLHSLFNGLGSRIHPVVSSWQISQQITHPAVQA